MGRLSFVVRRAQVLLLGVAGLTGPLPEAARERPYLVLALDDVRYAAAVQAPLEGRIAALGNPGRLVAAGAD